MARKSNRNSEGTSVAIGVTLMVLITIVLSAVIAGFSYDMVNFLNPQHNVGVRVARVDSQVVRIMTLSGETEMLMSGGGGHADASLATYTCMDEAIGLPIAPCTFDGMPATTYDASNVGGCMYFPVSPGGHISIVAHYTDFTGSEVYSGKVL